MSNNAKVELTGNLGKDPTVITQEGKKEFVALSIATTNSYKNEAGEWKDKEAVWHDVITFSPRAIESAKKMKKGDRVHIKGELSYKDVESKDGHKIQQASIVAGYIEKAPLVGRARE